MTENRTFANLSDAIAFISEIDAAFGFPNADAQTYAIPTARADGTYTVRIKPWLAGDVGQSGKWKSAVAITSCDSRNYSGANSIGGKIVSGFIHVSDVSGSVYTVVVGKKTYVDQGIQHVLVQDGTFEITATGDYPQLFATQAGSLYIGHRDLSQDILLTHLCEVMCPLFKTNHYIDSRGSMYSLPEESDELDANDFGVDLNGDVDNSPILLILRLVAAAFTHYGLPMFDLFIPQGNLGLRSLESGTLSLIQFKVVGDSKETSIISAIKDAADTTVQIHLRAAEDIQTNDILVSDGGVGSDDVHFARCKFACTVNMTEAYLHLWGFYSYDFPIGSVVYEDCVFDFNSLYIALCVQGTRSLTITGCSFTGNKATHVVRYNPHEHMVVRPVISIVGNSIEPKTGEDFVGFTTGFFVSSGRYNPVIGARVENNSIAGCTEESIGFDGFGNNALYVPVICNGEITAVSNDADGRLVITADMVGPGGACLVSSRDDWTNFYATFSGGSEIDGQYYPIHSFDAEAGAITVDAVIPAASVALGGFGVQSGFFNCVVAGNTIDNSISISSGVSLWLNCFGCTVSGNTITGGAQGITCSGGLMLSVLKSMSWANTITGNTITGVTKPLIVDSEYTDAFVQYDNEVSQNEINGGTCVVGNQRRFVNSGNVLTGGAVFELADVA